ncbi:MAG: molybdopterin-dependent oxidoreductase [Chloroflexi bacterium]|jgi:DMSO/TMAO reductase YedYZ molybdopterin-dependent catalytic subunit|nr:molybdopterin-dependent oxidoreductase [Chloroflexota bacterium]MBT7079986.1 molybdopterin-dependent oxidoreductase [Chloroflexota bacterium]MBT7290577.1 molybdopterin-dependent oxidoreductase [Chloroflexota bacterium]
MRRLFLLISALVVVAVLLASACRQGAIELSGIEVREYKGENLSSVQDFRDNSIKGPQYVDQDSYELTIDGLVQTPVTLSYDEVVDNNDLYKKVVTLNCVEGWSANILWEGMLVTDLFEQTGVLPEAKVVIFHAADGYTTSFAIEYITDNNIIMAYKMNDVTLPPERGFPFQLVAESKWGYKWIKWITRIELSDDINYKGYWEQRGYSNDGDLDGSKFD